MSKQMFWMMCVSGLVTAALLASGCLSASLGNLH